MAGLHHYSWLEIGNEARIWLQGSCWRWGMKRKECSQWLVCHIGDYSQRLQQFEYCLWIQDLSSTCISERPCLGAPRWSFCLQYLLALHHFSPPWTELTWNIKGNLPVAAGLMALLQWWSLAGMGCARSFYSGSYEALSLWVSGGGSDHREHKEQGSLVIFSREMLPSACMSKKSLWACSTQILWVFCPSQLGLKQEKCKT